MPTNTSNGLAQATSRKSKKLEYLFLFGDLENIGWKTHYDTVGIGALGHLPQSSCEAVANFLPVAQTPVFHALLERQGLQSLAHTIDNTLIFITIIYY